MSSVVEQLRHEALDRTTPVSDLLRKAKVVASKLNLMNALAWIEAELQGYRNREPVPDYRQVRGVPKARDPYQGWIPMLFTGNDEMQAMISTKTLIEPVGELEASVAVSEDRTMHVPFSPQQIKILADAFRTEPTRMSLFIGRSVVVGVLDAVRNKVLDWALDLEKAGINGDGLSFSPREKAVANNPNTTFNIGNIGTFSGNLGPVSGGSTVTSTQIYQAQLDQLRDLVGQVRSLNDRMGLTEATRAEMNAHVDVLDQELRKPHPEVGRMKGLLRSIRTIAESVTGNVVAAGIVSFLGNTHLP